MVARLHTPCQAARVRRASNRPSLSRTSGPTRKREPRLRAQERERAGRPDAPGANHSPLICQQFRRRFRGRSKSCTELVHTALRTRVFNEGVMQVKAANLRVVLFTLVLGLVLAPVVLAQSIVDARRVEFTPSTDHTTVDTNGNVLVQSYSLAVFVAGSSQAMQTVSLGKPALDVDGMIRLDFVNLLTTPLTPGVIYETQVSAVGPGGTSPSLRSNTFA